MTDRRTDTIDASCSRAHPASDRRSATGCRSGGTAARALADGSAVGRLMRGLDDLAGLDLILCGHPAPVQAGSFDLDAAARSVVARFRSAAAVLRAKLSVDPLA